MSVGSIGEGEIRLPYYLGVDLGGTQVRAGVLTEDGKLLARESRLTEAQNGLEAVLGNLNGVVERTLAAVGIGLPDVEAIGLSVPGPLDRVRGLVLNPPNLPGWREVPVVEIVGRRFGRPVFLENDANAAALGEARRGAGRGRSPLFYVTVSTGIGAGIVLDNRIYHGFSDAAGELGQTVVDPEGVPCGFGRRGCLESVASGSGILRLAREMRPQETFNGAEDVFARAEAGEAWARGLVQGAAATLGRALGNAVNLLNPAAVVIGGGVSRAGPIWWEPLRRELERTALPVSLKGLSLGPAALGDDAGLVGVGLLASEGLAAHS